MQAKIKTNKTNKAVNIVKSDNKAVTESAATKALTTDNKPSENKKPKLVKFTHDATNYNPDPSTQSLALRKAHSKTRITAVYNSNPDGTITTRDNDAINMLIKTYGDKPFKRGNFDAGIIRRLIERACINYHDTTSLNIIEHTFILTEKANPKPKK